MGSGGESVKKIEIKIFVGSVVLNIVKIEFIMVRLFLDEICYYFYSLLYGLLIFYFGFGFFIFCKIENLKRLVL